MSILSTLNKLTGKSDKSVLAALNSLTGKTADDIEEAMGNLGGGSAPMIKVVLLQGPYNEEVSPLFQSNPNEGYVKYSYEGDNDLLAEFYPTNDFSDLYGGSVLAGKLPAGAYIRHAAFGSSPIGIGHSGDPQLPMYQISTVQMYPFVSVGGAPIVSIGSNPNHIPLFVEELDEQHGAL